jgi:segregation and condensation protein B
MTFRSNRKIWIYHVMDNQGQDKTLEQKIEALLFWKGEPVTRKWLSQALGITEGMVNDGLVLLEEKLKDRGLSLLEKEDEVALGTRKEFSDLIEKVTKEELSRDIGRAGVETLAIVLYKGPISRRDIDYIRGVNSNFILRNLMIRGLVEKVTNEKDQRSFLYKPTFDLLSHLGIEKIEMLPEFEAVKKELEAFEKAEEAKEEVTTNENAGA